MKKPRKRLLAIIARLEAKGWSPEGEMLKALQRLAVYGDRCTIKEFLDAFK